MTRRFVGTGLLVAILAAVAYQLHGQASAKSPARAQDVRVYFSPKGGCQEVIVNAIAEAKQSVRIQAYSFTNVTIAKALLNAKKRGVQCEAILDASNRTDKCSAATFLMNAGIPVLIDANHQIAHDRINIIDEQTIITGSYNFSKSAEENNAENLLVLTGYVDLAKAYLANSRAHREHSTEYSGPMRSEGPAAQGPAPAAPALAVAANSLTNDETVCATRSGSKYHRAGCRFLAKSSMPIKLSDARAKYGPCLRCALRDKRLFQNSPCL